MVLSPLIANQRWFLRPLLGAMLALTAAVPSFAALPVEPTFETATRPTPVTRLPATRQPAAMSKQQLLEGLKQIQKKHRQDIESIDQSIKKTMSETQSVSLRGSDDVTSDKLLLNIPSRLARLQAQREELLLRRDFLDQLIFQVDSKFGSQTPAVFLEQTLLDMAVTELTSNSAMRTELWRFYTYLSIAIREIHEPREDLLAFLTGYIEFSTLKKPKTPLAYLNSRNYTNGAVSQAASGIRREDVGALVEKRMKEVGTAETSGTTDADIEIRSGFTSPKPTVGDEGQN